ncbi:hypothetical protein [Pseudoalteromonas obscura]|uniref:Uncharacterized protein n=1 Tax=Pseudoalteromonas obscura TaxID=3048491 RepID=A0ABT7EUG9_9GAMM|nr:hypothetical protein [Pseudoalteromonas sp. P94(2023)]MDK2598634.1 hypothetical protein [Pseudoalteromonas sp. P94(2023)]
MSQSNAAALIDTHVAQSEMIATSQDALLQLGQIQAFNFIGKLVTVTELKLVQQVKETKSYKGLTYYDENEKLVTVTTWDDCCKHILKTDRQNLDRRLVNLQQFGEEFFEQAQKMKLGYKDLRALRQLPEEDQTLVIESEAVDSGDKEAVKELIDELKDKHAKETEKLNTELDATERMLNASRKSAAEKEDQIVELRAENEHKKFNSERWKGETKNFFEVLVKTENQIREGFNKMLLLSEQLETIQMDDKTYDAAKSAFYADNKILLTQLAGMWNEIHRTYGDIDDAKPSGEWLAELGFEGTEVME